MAGDDATTALIGVQGALPYVTEGLPGTGGIVKGEVDDFEVEEIPAYEPSGTGEHLFLWVEKRGLDSRGLLRHVGRAVGIPDRDIGCAGLKDARAITRQYLSVPAQCEPKIGAIDGGGVRVLSAKRHGNKLKTGHLRGNRFRITVREPTASANAEAIVSRLIRDGVPNYYGPQRFGRDGDTIRLGLSLLRGERRGGVGGFMLRLALSAVQSALFNAALAERVRSGSARRAQAGEVLQVVASGGPFVVDDVAREQARVDAHEVVPAGPIFGPKMRSPTGAALERELELLTRYGLSPDHFAHHGKLMRGARRAMLIWPAQLEAKPVAAGLEVVMTLPKGSYATVVLSEILKTDALTLDEGESEESSA